MFKNINPTLEDVIRQGIFTEYASTAGINVAPVMKKCGLLWFAIWCMIALAPTLIGAIVYDLTGIDAFFTLGISITLLLGMLIIAAPFSDYAPPRTLLRIENTEETVDTILSAFFLKHVNRDRPVDHDRLIDLLNNNEHVVDLLVVAAKSMQEGNVAAPDEFVDLIHDAFHDEIRKLTPEEHRQQLAQKESTSRWDALRDLIRETTPNNRH